MSRKKVLLALLAVGLIAAAVVFIVTDAASYWASAVTDGAGRPATLPARPKAAPRPPEPVPKSKLSLAVAASPPATTKPATALVLDSKTTLSKWSPRDGQLLLRELPRQAILVTAAHEFGLPVVDRTVDLSEPPAGGRELGLGWSFDRRGNQLHVTLDDGTGAEAPALTVPLDPLDEFVSYAKLAPELEGRTETELSNAVAAAAGRPRKPAKWDAALASPAGVGEMLLVVDPHHAFLAARRLHAAVAATGESPERLAALARAYANLGEATRHLYSGHSAAFFARAMVYGERAVRKAPDAAASHNGRGYALALVGLPVDARGAFDRARQLTKAPANRPDWAVLADHAARFRTRELFDAGAAGKGAAGPLANYFALLTVEHAGLPSIVVNMARIVAAENPQSLRAVNVVLDNTGVGPGHEATMAGFGAQFTQLARLAEAPGNDVPAPVRTAAQAAARRGFAPDELRALLAAMDAQPAAEGQMLPWGAYAALQRDALFVTAFRRLYFLKLQLAVDPTKELARFWDYLKDHRYAAVLATFDKPGGPIAGKDLVARLNATEFKDIGLQAHPIAEYAADNLNLPPKAITNESWVGNQGNQSDGTAWDQARVMWVWRDKDAELIPMLSRVKGEFAKKLAKLCPDHPSAIAGQVLNDWANTKARAPQIEKEFGGNPQVALALARAYRADKREADAKRLLQWVVKIAPEASVYEEMIALEMEAGNEADAMATLEKLLGGAAAGGRRGAPAAPGAEDFGLDHSRAAERMATDLMRKGKFDQALPLARKAADSGAGWGLQALAACLTELKQFDEAEAILRAAQERYPAAHQWYRWCQTTGRGDLAAARQLSAEAAREADTSTDEGELVDTASFYQLEGQPERALACLRKASEERGEIFRTLAASLIELERGGDRAALAELSKPFSVMERPGQHRRETYEACLEALRECLQAPGSVPPRDGDVKRWVLDEVNSAYRGNACYFFGRLCELRGKRDDATRWYSEAMRTREWNFTYRPASAVALRRLGGKSEG